MAEAEVGEGPLHRSADRALELAGITRPIAPHWLRHFFASAALGNGVPANEVAEWLGHRDPKIALQAYAHIMPDAPERLRTVIDGVFLQELELNLPLKFDVLVEAACAALGAPHWRSQGSAVTALLPRPAEPQLPPGQPVA
ncbi:tyrosine-type recombinase/integrase [Kitasatospora sp. NPDC001664]